MTFDDLPNPFRKAAVIDSGVDGGVYLRQEPGLERGDPAFVMSRSALMAFRACPAKWKAGYESRDTTSTDWGTLLDCRVLTPKRFAERYILQPEHCPATKTMQCVKDGEAVVGEAVDWAPASAFCKAWKREQEKHGLHVLTAAEKRDSDLALKTLADDTRIATLLVASQTQVLVLGEYHDRTTDLVVPVKTLIDLVPNKLSVHGNCLADLKSARTAAPRAWQRVVDEMGYDAQAAMNLDLYNLATQEQRNTFCHVIQENTPPFQTARRMLSLEFVNLGRAKILSALRRYCLCLAAGHWPDYDEDSPYNGWGLTEPAAWMLAADNSFAEPIGRIKQLGSEPLNLN